MGSSSAFRRDFWNYHAKNGSDLAQWSWEWRLGWLKSCALEKDDYCSRIFRSALKDKAAIVRAEAAALLGERFAGSQDQTIIRLLTDSYESPANTRNDKPLFTQYRILYALNQIGGKKADEAASRLAAGHSLTANYLTKLTRF